MTLSLNYIFIYIQIQKSMVPYEKTSRQCGKSYPEMITEPYERI